MPLPKISTPTYELVIPSIKKKIKYRPFLVKEEKVLIIAMESEDTQHIANAIKEVISSCIITRGIKVDELSTFDIEYLFLNIRGKSVGEEVEVLITCPDDGTTKLWHFAEHQFDTRLGMRRYRLNGRSFSFLSYEDFKEQVLCLNNNSV